jgi:hypothetical protein
MAWLAPIENGPGQGTGNKFPVRKFWTFTDPKTGNPYQTKATGWEDPLIPDLADCRKTCDSQTGFFSGDTPGASQKWDGLLLYVGKLRRNLGSANTFWRKISKSDEIFLSWLRNENNRVSLIKLVLAESSGITVTGQNTNAICQEIENLMKTATSPSQAIATLPLYLLCDFFKKVNQADGQEYLKKTIFRTLTSVADVAQCHGSTADTKEDRKWKGNDTICWLCNQNITNIYLGGAPHLEGSNGRLDVQNIIKGEYAPSNIELASHSQQNKECEHCLPYIVGSYILQLFGGNNLIKEAKAKMDAKKMIASGEYAKLVAAKKVPPDMKSTDFWKLLYSQDPTVVTAREWQNLEYEWSHSYCNGIKSQGHFLQYNEETGQFEIDYKQIALFSKRLRCQGAYGDQAGGECTQLTQGGTARLDNWKTFSDESNDQHYYNNAGDISSQYIRTSCNPAAFKQDAEDKDITPAQREYASCRVSFATPSIIQGINNPKSEAQMYLTNQGIVHEFMSDTDKLISKMAAIVTKLNTVDPQWTPGYPNGTVSIGLYALIRARISTFLLAKYMDDVAKQLLSQNGTVNTIWNTSLPSPWNSANADQKQFKVPLTFDGAQLQGLASKFVIGLGKCCEAAVKTVVKKNAGSIDANDVLSWVDCCLYSSKGAYLSLDKIGGIKGEGTDFGVMRTRAATAAARLMANQDFVISLLTKINQIIVGWGATDGNMPIVFYQGTYQYNPTSTYSFQQYIEELKKYLTPNFIEANMANEAIFIIPDINLVTYNKLGRAYPPRLSSTSAYIVNHFQDFIINMLDYTSPISYFSNEELIRINSIDEDPIIASYIRNYEAAPNKMVWLDEPNNIEFMLEADDDVLNGFWDSLIGIPDEDEDERQVIRRIEPITRRFIQTIKNDGPMMEQQVENGAAQAEQREARQIVFSDFDAILWITNYLLLRFVIYIFRFAFSRLFLDKGLRFIVIWFFHYY